jgi:hypothetical protein
MPANEEDVALLAVLYVDRFTPVPVTADTLAGAMLMLAGRRITPERADMLIQELETKGLVDPT